MRKNILLFLLVGLLLFFSGCAGENDYPWNTNEEFQGVTFEYLTSTEYTTPLEPIIEGIPEIVTLPYPEPSPPIKDDEYYTLSGAFDYDSTFEHLLEPGLKLQKKISKSAFTYTMSPNQSKLPFTCLVCIYILDDEQGLIYEDVCTQLLMLDEKENYFKIENNYRDYIALGIDKCAFKDSAGIIAHKRQPPYYIEKPVLLHLETETGQTTNSFKLMQDSVDLKTVWVEQSDYGKPELREIHKILRAESEIILSKQATAGPIFKVGFREQLGYLQDLIE